ncbi:hypothetical protein AZH53_02930 [Methanomicrobiaceae archaeon CYW5]|nr:hypothetical protein [Methanovulcanius yangii]
MADGARDRTAPGVWRSASGTPCTRVFFCAALIERSRTASGGLQLRIADPTSACSGSTSPSAKELNARIEELSVPCFVSCAATVQPRTGAEEGGPSLAIEWMQEVPRHARDRWIISAARRAVAVMEDGHACDPDTISILAAAIDRALCAVDITEAPPAPPQDHIDAVLDAIGFLSADRTGADEGEVIGILATKGISSADAKSCITYLREEGDCYCPQPGRLRAL